LESNPILPDDRIDRTYLAQAVFADHEVEKVEPNGFTQEWWRITAIGWKQHLDKSYVNQRAA